MLIQFWRESWSYFEKEADSLLLDQILRRYREPHRYYHTELHLKECFTYFEAVKGLCE